jgi:hypothetical protein
MKSETINNYFKDYMIVHLCGLRIFLYFNYLFLETHLYKFHRSCQNTLSNSPYCFQEKLLI